LYRHLAWLTVLRFTLREKKSWENTTERGNAHFLAEFSTPESQSTLKDALNAYLSDSDVQAIMTHRGDKLDLILRWQYESATELYRNDNFSEYALFMLISSLDDLARLQGALKRIKNYPYARN
jgi:putative membrane protein